MKKRRFDKLMTRVPQELQELIRQSRGVDGWWKNDTKNRPQQLMDLAQEMLDAGNAILGNLAAPVHVETTCAISTCTDPTT